MTSFGKPPPADLELFAVEPFTDGESVPAAQVAPTSKVYPTAKVVHEGGGSEGGDEDARTGQGKKNSGQDSVFPKSQDRTDASCPVENRDLNPRPIA